MLDQLLNFISTQILIHPGEKILLAVSGGIDSMAMAHLFSRADFPIAIAHCNFGLRGIESDEDQQFVESFAKKHQIVCYAKFFDTEEYAKNHGISIQMAARELRRTWFEELCLQEKYTLVATAHHLNDSLETVLFNLAKGTGIAGLKGILPRSNGYIRPLMFASREMIIAYAREHQIAWREDQSNNTIKYHRNLIRHKVVPELKKINPSLENTLSVSLEKIAAAERVYSTTIENKKQDLVEAWGNGFKILKRKLLQCEEAALVLFEILEPYGFNYHQAKNIMHEITGQAGRSFLSSDYQLIIDRDFVYVEKTQKIPEEELLIYAGQEFTETSFGKLMIKKTDMQNVRFEQDKSRIFVDSDSLEFPLKIRPWKPGDRFQPLGFKHKKKLSDFMIDEKIPLNLKSQVRVLCSGNKVVWVIGMRLDERFKIGPNTKNALEIINQPNDDQPI